MSDSAPQDADPPTSEVSTVAPRVRVLLTLVPGSDLEAAFAVVARQVYEPAPEVHVIGDPADDELPDSVVHHDTLEAAIAGADGEIDYLWLLHADARPRPDALAALVAESEAHDASLAGSKLLKAGTMDELESVGGATDVFGEPFSGLDAGEIDLQQYDVVREVAFVTSASMLIRRDLAAGLRGLDPLLPPVAAGLDFSQRTRLAGGRVISVPSSEVYHQGRCTEKRSVWREQAGRLRAMLTAYSPLTLLWVIPYDLLVSFLDSLGSLLLFRWKPAVRHMYAWVWNLIHLPSTIGQRRRFKRVRSAGDEELFRFQASGSVRLRSVGEELSNRILSMFDDDQALAKGTERVWRSPGIWGAIIAAAFIAFAVRGIVFGSMPNTGFVFPFEPPTVALDRWFGGWNDSGLGSPAAVHPSVGLSGLVSWLWFGAEGAARTLMTIGAGFAAVVGMGRLVGRIGLRGPGRYLAGVVAIGGPAMAVVVGRGSWTTLIAAALLPWAVRAVFTHPSDPPGHLRRAAWVVALTVPVAMFSPVAAVLPLLVAVGWSVARGRRSLVSLGFISLLGVIAGLGFLLGDPGWLFESDRTSGIAYSDLWLILIPVAAVPLVFSDGDQRRLGLIGGVMASAALVALRFPIYGPGIEEGLAMAASFGAALIVAAAFDSLSARSMRIVAGAGALGMLVLVAGTVGNGRLGLPDGDDNTRFSFAQTLADDTTGPGRILIASVERDVVPGEARPGPGFWYRVLDGTGTTQDEVSLPEPLPGDEALDSAMLAIASGSDLRPGDLLADFAIDWVVLEGPSFRLDDVLSTQLDLVPTPLDRNARVFENLHSMPLAATDTGGWQRDGAGYAGDAFSSRVLLAVNGDEGWSPMPEITDWRVAVSAEDGLATYARSGLPLALAVSTILITALSIGVIVWTRRKS